MIRTVLTTICRGIIGNPWFVFVTFRLLRFLRHPWVEYLFKIAEIIKFRCLLKRSATIKGKGHHILPGLSLIGLFDEAACRAACGWVFLRDRQFFDVVTKDCRAATSCLFLERWFSRCEPCRRWVHASEQRKLL
jgi:hypothetical protein